MNYFDAAIGDCLEVVSFPLNVSMNIVVLALYLPL